MRRLGMLADRADRAVALALANRSLAGLPGCAGVRSFR